MFPFSRGARRHRAARPSSIVNVSLVECLEERRLLSAAPAVARATPRVKPFHVRPHDVDVYKSTAVIGQNSSLMAMVKHVKNIDPNAANASAFVNWGDGTHTYERSNAFTYSGNTLTLRAQHAYAAPGEYTFTVQLIQGEPGITDGGQLLSKSTGKIDVTPDPATPQGAYQVNDLNAVQLRSRVNHSINGAVATFTSDNPGLRYVAHVDWGDGRFSTAKVSQNADGSFYVVGKHTYTHRGDYVVTVTLDTTYSFITSNNLYGFAFSKSDAVIQSDA